MSDPVKINKADCAERTIAMLREYMFLDDDVDIDPSHDLRKKWDLGDKELLELEDYIEGPIGSSPDGFFTDVEADVSAAGLTSTKLKTVGNLIDLIWKNIPDTHK